MIRDRLPFRALVLALAGAAVLLAGPARADDVRLTMDQIQVNQTRERDGDRPYFASIVFRSRHNARGSTSVLVQEREPHDWVGKREHNPAGARNGHLHARDVRDIPRWMGRLEWNGAVVPRLDPRDRTTWEAVTRSEILGVIIIGLDNNNTPPHVVRGVLNKIAQRVRSILVRQVESGAIMRSVVADLIAGRQPSIRFTTNDLTRNLFSDGEKIDLFLGLTVGSTFNPDVITGIQVVILPGIDGAGPYRSPADQRVTLIPGRSPTTVRTLVAEPTARALSIPFDSDGANYRVRARLERRPTALDTTARIDSLRIRVDTGGDDLRSGGNAQIRAIGRDGRVLGMVNLTRGEGLPNHSTRTVTLPLSGGGVAPEQLSHITIRHIQGGGISADNWDVKRVLVEAVSGRSRVIVLDKAGAPLRRFTGSAPGPFTFGPFAGL